MCDKIRQFDIDQYVHLKDFLHKDSCAELTQQLKLLVQQKQTEKDQRKKTKDRENELKQVLCKEHPDLEAQQKLLEPQTV